MIVNVTQAHIDAGIMGSICACPIALAIKDIYTDMSVNVNSFEITVGSFQTQTLPHDAIVFISKFDDGGASAVHPFEFEVPLSVTC